MSIEDENVQSFLKNALIDSRNVIKEMSKEIIKDIIDAIDSRPAKKVETKTILSCEEFDNLKKRIRKEMAEEIIGDETLNSIFKDEKNLNSYDLSIIYDSVLYFRESATILRDEEKVSIEKILKIIRSD